MSRTLALNCTPIHDSSEDVRNTALVTASDEPVMWAVQTLCEFSLLDSQQNPSDLSLTALHNTQKQLYKQKVASQVHTISKSKMANEDEQLTRDSNQLHEQNIHNICTAMEVPIYRAAKITATKGRQFWVHPNKAQQAAMNWFDADWQRGKERLEEYIHLVTAVKCKIFDKVFRHHKWQLSNEVCTNAPCPRSIFAKN